MPKRPPSQFQFQSQSRRFYNVKSCDRTSSSSPIVGGTLTITGAGTLPLLLSSTPASRLLISPDAPGPGLRPTGLTLLAACELAVLFRLSLLPARRRPRSSSSLSGAEWDPVARVGALGIFICHLDASRGENSVAHAGKRAADNGWVPP